MDTNIFLFALLFVGFVRFVVVNILYTKRLFEHELFEWTRMDFF